MQMASRRRRRRRQKRARFHRPSAKHQVLSGAPDSVCSRINTGTEWMDGRQAARCETAMCSGLETADIKAVRIKRLSPVQSQTRSSPGRESKFDQDDNWQIQDDKDIVNIEKYERIDWPDDQGTNS